ncbi:MAG: pyridoxamine 5'-phosphate oxidase family protein [Gemmatimonadaceae bacterium]
MPRNAPSRTTFHIHPERSAPDELQDILATGLVAHVGIAEATGPVVIPMTYHYDRARPDTIYLHGATFGRLAPLLAAGARVCVTVTMLDGLVLSKTAKYHSVNYRSAVCFGQSHELTDRDEKRRIGDALVARYHPGRTAGVDFQVQPDAHVDATTWIAVAIEEASAKIRRGGPKGPGDDDPTVPGTAGLIEFHPHR